MVFSMVKGYCFQTFFWKTEKISEMAIWRPSPRQLFGHFGHWGHFRHTLLFLAGKGYCFQTFFWNSSFLVFLLFSCALFPEFFGPFLGNHWHFFGHPQNIVEIFFSAQCVSATPQKVSGKYFSNI